MIICNLKTGAVSEYDTAFESVTATHATSAAGMLKLGGDTDAGEPIKAVARLPRTMRGGTSEDEFSLVTRANVRQVFLAGSLGAGSGDLEVEVRTDGGEWAYPVELGAHRTGRCRVGRGIRGSYIGLELRNPTGCDFRIDAIQLDDVKSATRKVY